MAFPVAAAIAGGAAANLIGGMNGANKAAESSDKALALQRQALQMLQSISAPQERALALEEYKSAGIITPELEQAYLAQDTELQGIQLDPKLRQAQMGALSQLQQIGESGGLTLQDRANLNRSLGEIQSAERGSREAALQNLRARGMAGGGSELLASLQGAQSSATQANQIGLDIGGMAQQRALESLIQAGTMGGNIRGQDYGEAAKAAEAQDAINRFNLANRQDVQGRNVASRNIAQQTNLANQQALMSGNVDLRNEANLYNQQAAQRRFNNEVARATGQQNAMGNIASTYQNKAAQDAARYAGIGSAIGQGTTAYANYMAKKEENKNG